MSPRRVLLTGATGFIGGALLARLLADGHRVLALSRRGRDLPRHPRLEWRQLDILDAADSEIASALAGRGFTHCVHAAWYTHHADYLTHEVNREWVAASVRLVDRFVEAGGERFAGLGTCLEYDVANARGPCSEDSTPLRPETLYARCKLELFDELKQRGGNFAWARVFFVYGPGDRSGRLIQGMIERFSRGEASGPKFGGLRRDYVHVDDLASQLVRIAFSDARGAINTGTGRAPSLSDIFAAGADAIGRPELAFSNGEMGEQPPLIQADLTRFRREVGEPRARDIAWGIRDLIA